MVILTDSYGQWNPLGSGDIYTNGNVGIGTSTNLDTKLSLTGESWQLKLSNNAVGGADWRIGISSDVWIANGGKFLISKTGISSEAALTIDSQNRVGIGITNPPSLLSVSGDIALKYGSELKTTIGNHRTILRTGWSNSQDYLSIHVPGNLAANANPKIHIRSNGNVGIGTTNPPSLLSVSGDIALKYGSELKTTIGNHRTILRTGWSNSQDYLSIHVPGNLAANATPKIHIRSNGNVGIGTTSPGSRLTVKGNIHAEEVKVDLNVPGPDYVFDEDYELSSLEEVEKYIQENKHLPEIPSAADMEKTGIYLSEMNMKLLKKVEELTLHMINLHHEMKRLSKENELLKQKIK